MRIACCCVRCAIRRSSPSWASRRGETSWPARGAAAFWCALNEFSRSTDCWTRSRKGASAARRGRLVRSAQSDGPGIRGKPVSRAWRTSTAPVILLKAPPTCSPGCRLRRTHFAYDLDILVPRQDLERVEQALRAAGWREQRSFHDDRYYREWMHEILAAMASDRLFAVDVHHAILPTTSRCMKPDTQALFASAVRWERSLRVLCPADMVLAPRRTCSPRSSSRGCASSRSRMICWSISKSGWVLGRAVGASPPARPGADSSSCALQRTRLRDGDPRQNRDSGASASPERPVARDHGRGGDVRPRSLLYLTRRARAAASRCGSSICAPIG